MSNATDWISAGCNVVMASAAVYAAWNAKDWLSPSIHEQGLPIARELIGLRVYPFSENISSSDYCSQIMNLMNALLNHEDKLYLDSTNETNTTISLLSMIRGDIHKTVNYIIDEKSKIYQNIDSVNFLGWGMNSEKRKILDNMMKRSDLLVENFEKMKDELLNIVNNDTIKTYSLKTEKGVAIVKKHLQNLEGIVKLIRDDIDFIKTKSDEFKKSGIELKNFFDIR